MRNSGQFGFKPTASVLGDSWYGEVSAAGAEFSRPCSSADRVPLDSVGRDIGKGSWAIEPGPVAWDGGWFGWVMGCFIPAGAWLGEGFEYRQRPLLATAEAR